MQPARAGSVLPSSASDFVDVCQRRVMFVFRLPGGTVLRSSEAERHARIQMRRLSAKETFALQ